MPNPKRYQGEDAFGKFKITGGPCMVCDYTDPQLTVLYNNPEGVHFLEGLPKGVNTADTILRDVDNAIGINCGCYAKFHRQVTHIADRQKARANLP